MPKRSSLGDRVTERTQYATVVPHPDLANVYTKSWFRTLASELSKKTVRQIEELTTHPLQQRLRATQGTTGADGAADISAVVRRKVAVFVAHPQHLAGLYRQHDNGAALEVTLPAGNGIHSITFASDTGHIPKLGCRLAPIGDAHDAEGIPRRTYMYVTNGSVDGRPEQPLFFTVGRPMMLENSEGLQVRDLRRVRRTVPAVGVRVSAI